MGVEFQQTILGALSHVGPQRNRRLLFGWLLVYHKQTWAA